MTKAKRKPVCQRIKSKRGKKAQSEAQRIYLKQRRNFLLKESRFVTAEATLARIDAYKVAGHDEDTATALAAIQAELFYASEPVPPGENPRRSLRVKELSDQVRNLNNTHHRK